MNLLHSTYYHIKLHSPWNLEYDMYIVGTVSKMTIAEVKDYDIRANFFTKYGLGLSTYYSTIKNDTPIYFGYAILNKSPISLDIEKIFIPEPLIDFNNTFSYLIGSKPTFSISASTRFFKTSVAESKFAKDAESAIIKTLNSSELFIADTIGATYSAINSLVTQDIIDEFETQQSDKILENNQFILQDKLILEAKTRELYEKKLVAETAKTSYETKKLAYEKLIEDLSSSQQTIIVENNILAEVKQVMIGIIEKIKNGELNAANFTNFSEIYESVKNTLETE